MIRLVHYSFVCVLMLVISGCKACDEPALQISLLLDQQVYAIGDNIVATLTITNIQGESEIINRRMAINRLEFAELGEVAFLIHSPLGQEIPQVVNVNIHPPNNNFFISLEEGENISQTYILNKYYSPLVDPGEYTVVAYYRNYWDPDDGRIAWQGMITSNTATFIIEP